MQVGICYEENIKGEFMFSPLFEMLSSLHVITNPKHHLERGNWVKNSSEKIPDTLMEKIKRLGPLTDEWLIVMDFAEISPYMDLTIPQAITELEKASLYQWNKVFKNYKRAVGKKEKGEILEALKEYYEHIFQYEIMYLQPFLIRILNKEMQACTQEGLLNRIGKLHERIKINGTDLILYKNKEYHFDALKLKKIVITASTFISPHLLMLEQEGVLYLTKLVVVEEKKSEVPQDLVLLLKALGDESRLRILHEIRLEAASTKALAIRLNLTEAGISKHLNIMSNAGLVEKHRKGNYMLYKLKKEAVDYIPYRLYEYIMR